MGHRLRNMSIFDTRFVHDNVFAGDYVDHEHKRNLYELIVGQQGVILAHEVDELDQRIRDITKAVAVHEKAVSTHVPQGMEVGTFVALPKYDDLEHLIVEKEAEVNALKTHSDIAATTKLRQLTCPTFPPEFATLLARPLMMLLRMSRGVSATIWRRIRTRLLQTWLSQGLDFVHDERCPFCDQPLATSPVVLTFRTFFSKAYGHLKAEITAADTAIVAAFGEPAACSPSRKPLPRTPPSCSSGVSSHRLTIRPFPSLSTCPPGPFCTTQPVKTLLARSRTVGTCSSLHRPRRVLG